MKKKNLFVFSMCILLIFAYGSNGNKKFGIRRGNNYYLNLSGNDNNDGTKERPWKTIDHLNSVHLKSGDSVIFQSGQIFSGSIILDSNECGTNEYPIVITSTGNINATISSDTASSLNINQVSNIEVFHLNLTGAGRKNGNKENGLAILNCTNVFIDSLNISGFKKAGLLVYASSDILVTNVYAHDNGFAGISVSGIQSKDDCKNIYIGYCKAENNPGDPTNFDNHSGNGIIAGFCKNVTIEYSSATNNGWDMPRKGNGPVGIWCYEADSVIIQHCIAYRNKTSPGASDGGGFDLDGGTTNSVIQYCLSYENEGSAFGLFQYAGASAWHDNTVRFCISENDGNVSAAHAGIFIWNSSHDTSQLKNCLFYNNVIYNEKGAVISYATENENSGFRFYNNIFVAKDSLILGKEMNGTFLGNNWWSLTGDFNIGGIKDFEIWAKEENKKQSDNKIIGYKIFPDFKNPDKTNITDPLKLKFFDGYALPENSFLKQNGLDLKKLFNIETGSKDFNGKVLETNGTGACF